MNKRGMYIVEASLIMPVFIISMGMLLSLIPVISNFGELVFSTSDELRLGAAKSGVISGRALIPLEITRRAYKDAEIKSFRIRYYDYDHSSSGIDDLVTISFKAGFKSRVLMLPVVDPSFSWDMTARKFTGSTHKVTDMDETIVYIFPEAGRKYHKHSCRYLKSHYRMAFLDSGIRSRYHACPLCGAKDIRAGSAVLIFEKAGEAYHTSSCRSIEKEKYYTDCTRSSATAAGYTACSVCGG